MNGYCPRDEVLSGRHKKAISVDGNKYLLLVRDETGPPDPQVILRFQNVMLLVACKGSILARGRLLRCGFWMIYSVQMAEQIVRTEFRGFGSCFVRVYEDVSELKTLILECKSV